MENMIKFNNASGHTLMEIMVVLIVIGILTIIALPNYALIVESTKKSEAIHVLEALRSAQNLYFFENNIYATNIIDLEIDSFPLLKNFTVVAPLPGGNNPLLEVARVRRIAGDGYTYDIFIDGDGEIHCPPGTTPANICSKLGLDP